jgi:hypothetical protein
MARTYRVRPFFSARPAICLIAGMVLFLSLPGAAVAQTDDAPWASPAASTELIDWSDEVPAHVSVVEGEAWLDRDGVGEAAAENTPLLAGDRLRTGRGRMEVVFADGSALTFDEDSDAEFLSDELLRLDRGRLHLHLARTAGAAGYRIDAAGTTISIRTAGDYRVSLDAGTPEPRVQVLVIRGIAELTSSQATILIRAGFEAVASARAAPSLPYAVTVSDRDTFDRWTTARRDERTGYATTRYLPAEISHYSGVLADSGDWQYESTHGYVWYPRVADDWQPYSVGQWSFVGRYGWVWTGGARWSWATHHYGRWGVSGRRYYWIPDRRWAPAWVAWGTAPGYIGWCPLGFDNRPLISVHIGYSNGWRGWNHAPLHGFNRTRVVVINGARHQPLPRSVRFAEGYRGPGRPAGVSVSNRRGLRGPAPAGRSPAAVARYPERTTANDSRPGGQLAGPDRRTAPASESRGGGALNRRSAGAADVRPGSTGPRADMPRRGATPAIAPSSRSRGVDPARRAEPVVAPGTGRAPSAAAAAARARRPAPDAAGAVTSRGAQSDRVVAPRTEERRDRRAVSEARYGVPARVERGAAPESVREPAPRQPAARQPAAPSRAAAPGSAPPSRERPAPRERPTASPSRERATAPPRAPRAEAARPAERQAPSAPAPSGGGRAAARNRDR